MMCALAECWAPKLSSKRRTRGLDPKGLGKAMCAGSCDGQPVSLAREGVSTPIAVTARPHSERGRHSRSSATVSSPFNYIPPRSFSRAGHLRPAVSSRSAGRFFSASELGEVSRRLALECSNFAESFRSAMTSLCGAFDPSIGSTSPVRFLQNPES